MKITFLELRVHDVQAPVQASYAVFLVTAFVCVGIIGVGGGVGGEGGGGRLVSD